MTPTAFARRHGISRQWVLMLLKQGRIPGAVKLMAKYADHGPRGKPTGRWKIPKHAKIAGRPK